MAYSVLPLIFRLSGLSSRVIAGTNGFHPDRWFCSTKRLLLIVGLIGTLFLSRPLVAAEVVHHACQIRRTTFDGWDAEELSNEWLQLTIVKRLGGRLMQVAFAGHPYLFVNPKYKGQYIPPEQANGQWFNYGGDKIWPLPEGHGDEQHWPGPLADQLDDGAYDLTTVSQAPFCAIRLDGPPDPRTGLQYSRQISITRNSPQILFHAEMKNATTHPIRWSMQSVTQYDTSDVHNPGQYNRDFWALTPVNPLSAYFNGYQVRSGLADDPSFAVSDGLFKLHWAYLENEVWLDTNAGWVAVVDGASQFAMVERSQYFNGAEYPGKATTIFYKNGASLELDQSGMPILRSAGVETTPYYMEAEINSPMVALPPGQTYAMDTGWFPTRADRQLRDVTSSGVILTPFSVTPSGDKLLLSGSFGIFFPGKLRAHLLEANGTVRQTVDVGSVDPRTRVDLRKKIALRSQPSRISLHLVDDQGVDRGTLGETAVPSTQP